jgi:hypothetical protein
MKNPGLSPYRTAKRRFAFEKHTGAGVVDGPYVKRNLSLINIFHRGFFQASPWPDAKKRMPQQADIIRRSLYNLLWNRCFLLKTHAPAIPCGPWRRACGATCAALAHFPRVRRKAAPVFLFFHKNSLFIKHP